MVPREVFQLWRRSPPKGLQGVERDASKIPLLGKLAVWPPLPIQTGDQDDDFYFVAETTMEGDGAGELHQCNKYRDKQKRKKRKDILDPLNRRQPWQV